MLKIFGGGTCQKLVKNRIFHKKQCFLRDMSFLELHYWSTNYSLFIIHGKEVHFYAVILNPIVFTEWIYGMAYRVSQSRRFRPKKKRIFFAWIDSESSETYSEPIFNIFQKFCPYQNFWWRFRNILNIFEKIEKEWHFTKKQWIGWIWPATVCMYLLNSNTFQS